MSLDVRLRPCVVSLAATVILTCIVLLALWQSHLDIWLCSAFSLSVVVAAIYHVGDLLKLTENSVQQIQSDGADWWLSLTSGQLVKAELRGPLVILPWVISLRFRACGRDISCAVTALSVTKTEHRRLRILLLQVPARYQAIDLSTVSRWYQNSVGRMLR